MPEPKNIVIIGGTACGPKVAARARRCDPRCNITLIEQGKNFSTATCGLPYFVSQVIESKDGLVARPPEYFKYVLGIDVRNNTRAVSIDRKARKVEVTNLQTGAASSVDYDKLVLATGSMPLVPDLKGKDLNGIFMLNKIEDALNIYNFISEGKAKKAVVVGAGLIGMEMTDAFARQGLEVTVVEALDRVLPTLLDIDTAAYVEKRLREKGINLIFGHRVTGFGDDENGNVKSVIAGQMEIEADVVLMALGNRPNTLLARNAGLDIGPTGGIAVDRYLRTSDHDIYAGGDCVENTSLITGQKTLSLMGSTANKHGRIIGTNVTGGSEEFPGVLGTAIVKIFDYNVGRVGLSEAEARKAGYDVVTSLVPADEYASFYWMPKEILVKLVADKVTNRVLGGQVVGPGETAKRVDVLAAALTFGAGIDALANIDLAYAPPYNSAIDPLHHAANMIRNKQSGMAKSISFMEVKKKLQEEDDILLIDVRNPDEWEAGIIDAPKLMMIPVGQLKGKIEKLPAKAEIIVYCKVGVRAYMAQRILENAGFKNSRFLEGSIQAWPYGIVAGPKMDSNK